MVCRTKCIWSHYLLFTEGATSRTLDSFRRKAGPHLTLSMLRLCTFVEQTTLPRPMRSRLENLPVGSAHPTSYAEQPAPEAGWSAEQSASGATTFSSPKERPAELWLPSAGRPGLTLHYQCCDYAPLWSRPPCPPCDRGCKVFSVLLRRYEPYEVLSGGRRSQKGKFALAAPENGGNLWR